MAKSTEQLLTEARARRDKCVNEKERILQHIKREEGNIRQLEQRRKRELEAAAIKKIEATGFSLEEVLEVLAAKVGAEEEEGEK